MEKGRILVGTLAYNGMVHMDYVSTILNLQNSIKIDLFTISNESNIRRGRNKIFSYFVKHKDKYDYLLFLDSDIYADIEGLLRMIGRGKDIIGAPVRLKNPQKVIFNFGEIIDKSQFPLYKVTRVGTAVLLISSKVAEKVQENEDRFSLYEVGDEDLNVNKLGLERVYDLFQTGVKDGKFVSTDYYFCDLMRELGFDIWVDMEVKTTHAYYTKLGYGGVEKR